MAKRKPQGKRRSAAQWAETIDRWKASGLSSAAFAEREGVKARTLVWWSCELRRRGVGSKRSDPGNVRGRSAFSEVRVVERTDAMAGPAQLEVVARGGRVIRVVGQVDGRALRTVLEVVESC